MLKERDDNADSKDHVDKKDFYKLKEQLQDISWLNNELNKEIFRIKDELDEHLTAINENTNEIDSNFTYMNELNSKIDKMSQRIEQIEIFLSKLSKGSFESKEQEIGVSPLSAEEQKLFLLLYASDDKEIFSYSKIAKKLSITEFIAQTYLNSLIEKGVPILKEYVGGKILMRLSREFKDLQAKKSIVRIQESILLQNSL